jgi:competence CoiA-like predicted nuclease
METVNEVPSRNKQLNVMETEYLQKFLTEEGTPVGLVWVKRMIALVWESWRGLVWIKNTRKSQTADFKTIL